jgi:hypothetical protein
VTRYRQIGSQRGRVSTQVRARQPCDEGGVGGAGPSQNEDTWGVQKTFCIDIGHFLFRLFYLQKQPW